MNGDRQIRVEFTLDFMTANAAVQDDPAGETARILRDIADRIENQAQTDFFVRDSNGNEIGRGYYTVEEDD